jgi:hypothetical protein
VRSGSELTLMYTLRLGIIHWVRSKILDTQHLGRQTQKPDFISRVYHSLPRKLALIFGRSIGTALSERKKERRKKNGRKKNSNKETPFGKMCQLK